MERTVHVSEDSRTVAVVEAVAGTVAIAATAAASVVAFPGTDAIGRNLIVAVAVGVLAARFRSRIAAVVAAICAALIVVTCLAPDGAAAAGDPAPWGFTPLIAFTLLLGRGYRLLVRPSPHSNTGTDTSRVADQASLVVWSDRPPATPSSDKLGNRRS